MASPPHPVPSAERAAAKAPGRAALSTCAPAPEAARAQLPHGERAARTAATRERLYHILVTAVRVLLGTDLLVNGVNWWFKLIGPYPSISDYLHHPPPPDFVGAMIQTGIIFHIVKATELLTGIALLTNRFVPLMLVVVVPITVPVFLVDDLISHHLRAKVMGTGALVMNTFLVLAYLSHYRRVLIRRGMPDALSQYGSMQAPSAADDANAWSLPRLLKPLMPYYGVAAILFGIVMVIWVAVLMVQYFTR